MIESILIFSFKSTVCSAIFAAYYMFALRNTQIYSFNRAYLLCSAFLSLLLPFIKFNGFNIAKVLVPNFPLLNISSNINRENSINAVSASDTLKLPDGLMTAYLIITGLIILRVVIKLMWVYNLKRKGQETLREGFILIKTDHPSAPFSFLNMLFWPSQMPQDNTEGESILTHELTHIRKYHTYDKILMELMLAACWLNPFNWLIKHELWQRHEFQADSYAVKNRDSETFARMLLYDMDQSNYGSIINPFSQSHIKRRLLMLTQPAENSYGFLRRFLSIPVFLIATLLLTSYTKEPASALASSEKIVVVMDAGHGGEDAGGRSVYGYEEKDMTLAIYQKLASLSKEYNIVVIATRDGNVNTPLEERLKMSNNNNAALFISVHMNKSNGMDIYGNDYQLGINPESANYNKSILLASSIANKLKTQKLSVEVVDNGKAYLIKENKLPALLIQCGNIDDDANIALLRDEAKKETLCRNILSGIVDYHIKLNTK